MPVQPRDIAVYEPATPTLSNRLVVHAAAALHRRVFPVMHNRGAHRLSKVAALERRLMRVRVMDATVLIPAVDAFWGPYVFRRRPYEPEIGHALAILGPVGAARFLDCGANYGYWAARVRSGEFGQHDVTAIEASVRTFKLLRLNLGAAAMHAAISDCVGQATFSDSLPHQARSLNHDGTDSYTIPTVDIDSLAGDRAHVLIKLDVEGAESAAVAGAAATIAAREVAFLYEDHASDRGSASTAAMWGAGLEIYYVDPVTASAAQVTDVGHLLSIKQDRSMGYNFVAVRAGGQYSVAMARHTDVAAGMRPSRPRADAPFLRGADLCRPPELPLASSIKGKLS